ncbi:hypothetical protein [Microbulbifer epialgicus]|uniref:Lipoprotein n=1 Tax=Microbulbifer epialgicus TaxID=393907 RepID=A0ABV4P6U3_9GAMM
MKKLLIALPFVISGCSLVAATSKEVSPGTYAVTAGGNIFSKREDLQSKIDKKAIKLCGPGAYRFIGDAPIEVTSTSTYVNGTWMDVPGHRLTRVVVCQDTEVQG